MSRDIVDTLKGGCSHGPGAAAITTTTDLSALAGRTPLTAFHARLKARPEGLDAAVHYRVRHDRVDKTGRVGMPASPSWPLCRHPARHSRAFGAPHGTPRASSPPDRWMEA